MQVPVSSAMPHFSAAGMYAVRCALQYTASNVAEPGKDPPPHIDRLSLTPSACITPGVSPGMSKSLCGVHVSIGSSNICSRTDHPPRHPPLSRNSRTTCLRLRLPRHYNSGAYRHLPSSHSGFPIPHAGILVDSRAVRWKTTWCYVGMVGIAVWCRRPPCLKATYGTKVSHDALLDGSHRLDP